MRNQSPNQKIKNTVIKDPSIDKSTEIIKSLADKLFSDINLLTQSELRTLLNLVDGNLPKIFIF